MNTPRSVLALDLGTNFGWAVLRADGRVESGGENLTPKTGQGAGQRFVKFHRFLVELKSRHQDLGAIHYELVAHVPMRNGAPHSSAAGQIYGGLLAIVQMFGEHHQIPYEGHHIMTVKKQFTGSGKAQKCDVIEQCRALGFRPASDNEADAIAVLHVGTNRCPILTMSGATPKGPRAPKPQPELKAGQNPF